MDVVILLVFISLVLVAAGLLFFTYRLRQGDFEHGDRLALTPLAEDETDGAASPDEEEPATGPSDELCALPDSEGGRPHVEC